MRLIIITSVLLIVLASCNNGKSDENALVSYDGKSLYLSDLKESFPEGLNKNDSIKLLNKLVDNWITRQLLYDRAMRQQIHNEDEIQRKVEQYEENLVIHQYKSRLVSEKIDTTITVDQIKNYFDKHSSEFRLTDNIAKFYFVKIPKSVPNAYKVREWMYQVSNEDKLMELKEYSYQNARFYDFDNEWVNANNIYDLINEPLDDSKKFLENYTVYQKRDSLYYYFLRVNEYLLKGDLAPMDYILSDLKQIILSKRRIEFINTLESNLRREAKNNKKIQINL
ncbi:MAG: hypothetical protein C0599_15620 [Salinivirgaceae bacterium]|nr:MAG: hypothetical protein C0599_15620 [Salinivirgaceae bacterium]